MHEVADDTGFGGFQLGLREAQVGGTRLLHQTTDNIGGVVGRTAGPQEKQPTVERCIVVGVDIMRHIVSTLELGVEHRVVASAEEVAEHVEGRGVGITGGDAWESNLHPRQLRLERKDGHARRSLYGFLMTRTQWQRPGGNGPKTCFDGRQERGRCRNRPRPQKSCCWGRTRC